MLGIKKIVIFPLFLLGCLLASGQEESVLENIHLHLNKTSFFKGEHLWFKAYVQDQITQLPSSTTTNLHVGIFSKEGKEIAKKLLLVNKGVCYGDFKIDSSFVADSYTLMAWTHYMKNFEVATPFLQKITIVGAEPETTAKAPKGLTIFVRPEGQQLVADTFNNVGLLVYDKALNPIKTNKIQLVAGDGTLLQSNIQTNELGQGRFRFFVDSNQSYALKIKIGKGQWITKKLESNPLSEIGISVDNSAKDVVVLTPKWSNATLNTKAGTKFTVAIFNQHKISFKQSYLLNRDKAAISVSRNEIPSGMNTAVILDEDMQPLSQRMFFNKRWLNERVHPIEVSYCLTQNKDSLQLDLLLPKGRDMANMSISVLPAQTKAYVPNNSISSSFLVQPYLKQQFVNGRYFFEGTKRSKEYQLDTRLLLEGTEKFNWNLKSIDLRNTRFEKENHIAFKGKVLDADIQKEKQVSVMSPTFGSFRLLDLSSNKDFEGNLPLFEGDSILISVLNHKGKLRQPKAELYFNGNNEGFFNYTKWLRNVNEVVLEKPPSLKTNESFTLPDKAITLDEVVVTGNAKKTNKFQIDPVIEGRIIDKETQNKYKTLISYIRKLGFIIRSNYRGTGLSVFVFDSPNLYPVPVIINGMAVSPDELVNIPLSSIQSLVYRKWLTPGEGPFISASLRYDYDELYGRGRFTRLAIPEGFNRMQAYFNPNYPDFTSPLYQEYGAIWWESQMEVSSETPKSITVPLHGQKEVKVIIEGMSTSGFLYETEQLCSPFQNNDSDN